MFTFDKDGEDSDKKYVMTHRYRNPYKYWVEKHDLREESEYKCTQLNKIDEHKDEEHKDACLDVEWDFAKLDWS